LNTLEKRPHNVYDEDDLLPISSLQHLAFCERQWSLIHMEGEWSENVRTIEGKQLHEYVHEQGSTSKSGVRLVRGLKLRSFAFGLFGVADLVEFHKDDSGAPVSGLRGRYVPFPVEYKRGRKRYDIADEIQLCAQTVCLEEMFGTPVPRGAVYYGQPKRRAEIALSEGLRARLSEYCVRARELLSNASRARPNVGRHCASCSLAEQCMPEVLKNDASAKYVAGMRKFAAEPLK
jgi:CRISPR-associated exonuclease Cas4